MAMLEVHDGTGRVERVAVSRDQPVMFGSSPKCDIVLAGEGVLPFHGRVRWQARKGRFKVDASPDAEFLWVNGQKMASSSFRQGDEVQVGPCHIYMINEGEAVPSLAPGGGPARPSAPAPRDEPTRVQPPPFLAPPAAGATIARGSRRATRPAEPAGEEFDLDGLDLDDFERVRRRRDRQAASGQASASGPVPAAARPRNGWGRFRDVFSARGYAPGEERVLSSPLAIGLGVTFAVLVLVGVSLFHIIRQTAANRLYNQALQNLEDGDYRTSMRQFDRFLQSNPEDPRAPKARVHRAMANVRQYTAAAGASWSLALEAERAMVESVGDEPDFRDAAPELEELVIRTGEELADRARSSADPEPLAEAESAVGLHAKVAGPAAAALLKKSRLPDKLAAARAAVTKARVRGERLAAMDAAIEAGSTAGVYAARDALVAAYPDLNQDRAVVGMMTRANDLVRKGVTVDPSGRPAETEPRAEPLGPPTSLVLRDSPAGPKPDESTPPVFALADGLAVALDGATGSPLWQVPVGLASPFPPQPIPGGTTVLAVDARHNDLLRLDARTGRLVWRLDLGERVTDPPLVLGNQVFLAAPGGTLFVVDLSSGALRGSVKLGMPLARAPVADESGRALYLAAETDVLFTLTRDPLGCAAVDYLGHAPGAIGATLARVGRYLIVPENHALNESRWRVFVLDEDGLKMTPVQQVPVLGWTWGTPAASGSVVWSAGDRGGVSAFALGAYGEKDPFRLIARVPPDAEPSGPAFALARSERELLVASGRSGRYELDPERAKVRPAWTLAQAGPAAAPPQAAGSRLVLTQQNTDGPGVGLWGVDPAAGKVLWRTVLGSPWPSPPATTDKGDRLAALGPDGRPVVLTHEALARGGFVDLPIPKADAFRLPPGAEARVEGERWTAVVPALRASSILVREGDGAFRRVGLPAPVGARPLAWGRELLVPGENGHAYLIDPLTGEPRAEPYVPPFDRERRTRWRAPARLSGDAVALVDAGGRVRRVVRENAPGPRLVVSAEVSLGKEVVSDPASTGGALVLVTADGQARALSARDLSPAGTWPLDAPLAAPPSVAAGRCFLATTDGHVLALGADGQRAWSATLERAGRPVVAAGAPAVRGRAVWFLGRGGALVGLSLDDGALVADAALDFPPVGGPVAAGDDLAVPVGLGAVRLLAIDAGPSEPKGR